MNENIVFVPAESTAERRAEYQKQKHSYKVGDYVKKNFRDPNGEFPNENMWVLITEIHEEKVIGTLDNYPSFLIHVKCGDTIEVKLSEILQHIPA